MFLYIDFLSNDGSFAYTRDKAKIDKNISIIDGNFKQEIESYPVSGNKNCFVTYAGIYIIVYKKDSMIMQFINVTLIKEVEYLLFETEKYCNKETATRVYDIYLQLSKYHLDTVGFLSDL